MVIALNRILCALPIAIASSAAWVLPVMGQQLASIGTSSDGTAWYLLEDTIHRDSQDGLELVIFHQLQERQTGEVIGQLVVSTCPTAPMSTIMTGVITEFRPNEDASDVEVTFDHEDNPEAISYNFFAPGTMPYDAAVMACNANAPKSINSMYP